jgi:hypothetical protein
MISFEQFRSLLAWPAFSYYAPLLILVCFVISFRHWLHARWYASGAIYALSLLTTGIVRTVSDAAELAGLVGGILAPALYGFLFVCFGVIRVLSTPYAQQFSRRRQTPPSGAVRLIQGAVGSCVGGVTGSTLGALLSALFILLFPLPSASATLDWQYIQPYHSVIGSSVTICGFIGVSLGGLMGWGYLNQRRLNERILISLTIQLFLLLAAFKRLLQRK